jgi:glycosyltransferase involved in cell wall biosynthesis
MNGTRIAVIIPTLNEAHSIGTVVRELARLPVARIIVADGGSTDATAALALAAGAEVLAAGRGYGRACQAGALAASNVEILVFMDGDGADDPSALPALIEPIVRGERDFVLGARRRGLAEHGSLTWLQSLAGFSIGLAAGLFCGKRYTDMCAFRAIRRDTLLGLGMREMTYGWNLEMQLRASRAGLRIVEMPIRNRRRIGGVSKVSGSPSGTLKAGTRIAATFIRVAASAEPVANPSRPYSGTN